MLCFNSKSCFKIQDMESAIDGDFVYFCSTNGLNFKPLVVQNCIRKYLTEIVVDGSSAI